MVESQKTIVFLTKMTPTVFIFLNIIAYKLNLSLVSGIKKKLITFNFKTQLSESAPFKSVQSHFI